MLVSSGCSESLGVHGHGSSGQSAAAALPTSSNKTSRHTMPAKPALSTLRARSVRLESHAHACQALASSGCGTAAGAAERTRLP